MTEQTDIRVTPISNQGLAGLPPTGWSSIAVVDIRTFATEGTEITGKDFGSGTSLRIPVLTGLNLTAAGASPLVKYDAANHQWIVQTPGVVSSDSAFITASIPSTGQYAFILPDDIACSAIAASAVAPCGPTPNSVLSTLNSSPTATGRVVPAVAPAAAGVKATGEIILSLPSTTIPSGAIVNARVTERFDLLSGEVVLPSDYTQDLVLYRSACITNSNPPLSTNSSSASSAVKTVFPVTPSREYTIVDLMKGKVGVEISLSQGAEGTGTMVGTDGARLLDKDGNVLVVPQNGLTRTVPVETRTIAASTLTGVVGGDFTLLRAVQVNLSNQTLAGTAELSIPTPSNMPADAQPFVAQPSVHTNADGTQEQVYVVHDSAKVVNGRLTTASPPFDGVLGYGPFVFLFTPAPLDGPVVISGYAYRDMDGIGGFLPGPGGDNDKPIKGAVIRSAAAYNFISYSKEDGHYAAYGFSTLDVCRSFATTAIHPQTMYRHTANITTCDVPYIVNNFNFRLADKDTQIPDKTKPLINMNVQVAPSQGPDAKFVAGTVPVNTELELPISVIDQEMGQVTLSIFYATSMSTANYAATITQAGSSIHAYITPDNPVAIYKYDYQPNFGFPIAGNASGRFKPNQEGTYTFVLEAKDTTGNISTRTMTVRAVQPGTQPDGVDGPPMVDEIIPADGAKDVMVNTAIVVAFNEPVKNVTETTLKLRDLGPTNPPNPSFTPTLVPAYVSTGIEGGRVKATLQPRTNLTFGHKYEVVVTRDITDSVANPSAPAPYAPPPGTDFCRSTKSTMPPSRAKTRRFTIW